jgi:hypothetical protein
MRTTARTNPLNELPRDEKISPQFSARLGRLKPDTKLHAIVLLQSGETIQEANRPRRTLEQRYAAIEEIRVAATDALKEIDDILRRSGGQRLSEKPGALGTILVESNPIGIAALANSSHVKAILENQPMSRVR